MIMPTRRSGRIANVVDKVDARKASGRAKKDSTTPSVAPGRKRSANVKDDPDVKSVPAKRAKKGVTLKAKSGAEEVKKEPKKVTSKKETKASNPKKMTSKKTSDKDVDKSISGPYDDLASQIKDPGWQKLLEPTLKSEEFRKIIDFLNTEHAAGKEIFPPKDLIFNSMNLTPLDKVKAIILGQDPYHDGSAHGLAFSILPGQEKLPSSLKTLYKELDEDPDIEFTTPNHGCLTKWAERGVLMLNAVLTVEAHKANSHSRCGWSAFTDQVIQLLSGYKDNYVFVLWGNFAKKKQRHFKGNQIIIEGAHPSGLTCGKFYGCRHFSKVNDALKKLKKDPIDWKLT